MAASGVAETFGLLVNPAPRPNSPVNTANILTPAVNALEQYIGMKLFSIFTVKEPRLMKVTDDKTIG